MKRATALFIGSVASMAVGIFLTPTLAQADFDYSPVKALFSTPQKIGDCTVRWEDNTDPSNRVSGWIVASTENRGTLSVSAPNDESFSRQVYSAYDPGKKTYYTLNSLPHEAKSGLYMTKRTIRIDSFLWEGVMFAGMSVRRAEIRLDGNGKPIEVKVGRYIGMYIPLPGGNSLTAMNGDGIETITCRAR